MYNINVEFYKRMDQCQSLSGKIYVGGIHILHYDIVDK